ncbi:MAG: hypothetical protein J2P57_06120 [Acidimicrobiaceae bacterium]|nr:hypothetical protein [Acidimicrobiaceae bacterium]
MAMRAVSNPRQGLSIRGWALQPSDRCDTNVRLLWRLHAAGGCTRAGSGGKDMPMEAEALVNRGAMALGHPIGATGGMLIGTLLDEMERRDVETGLVCMCTGGGMGTATIIERV